MSKDEWKQLVLAQSAPLIGADDARAAGFTGAGQAVAILDSGVDTAHSFFSGRVVSEACFSTDFPVLDLFTNCPNGLESQTGPGAATPPSSTLFGYDHGTHVAGIAAGGDNITPYSGVAPAAPIIAIQITTNIADQSVGIVTSDMILGLEQVYDLRNTFDIAAVNLSLGSGSHIAACDEDPSKPIIDTLRSVGIASIAASGNEGTTDATLSPACISTAISVGSTEKNDTVSSFSNSASFLDLLAPGGSITSSVPGGGFGIKSGTSMATPHVTGAFAVLRSKNPGVNVVDMLSALANTGQSILDPRNGLTKPRIQVDTALTQIPGISSRDDILVNFGTGTGGLWAYLNDTTWKQLNALGVSVLATGDIDESGKDDVVVVFPGLGTWVYIDNIHWEQVHFFDAEAAVIGDLNDQLGEDIILDFGPGIGIWVRYDNNNATWTGLHGQSPELMAVGRLDGGGYRDLIVDFGASGLWVWMNNASWVPL
ncbi:MAG: S8 family serine peptidase, partial [Nitrospinaceae bacterium]